METSLREAFNLGYDIILVSDATASSNRKHYESTLENVKDYYGIVIELRELLLLSSQHKHKPRHK